MAPRLGTIGFYRSSAAMRQGHSGHVAQICGSGHMARLAPTTTVAQRTVVQGRFVGQRGPVRSAGKDRCGVANLAIHGRTI